MYPFLPSDCFCSRCWYRKSHRSMLTSWNKLTFGRLVLLKNELHGFRVYLKYLLMSKIFVIISLFLHIQQKALVLLTLLYLSFIVSDSICSLWHLIPIFSSLILYCTTIYRKIHSLHVDIFLSFSHSYSLIYYALIILYLIKKLYLKNVDCQGSCHISLHYTQEYNIFAV